MKLSQIACMAGAFALAACATEGNQDREPPEELAKYDVTGETEQCLSLASIKQSKPLDDYNILFETRGNETYLSRLPTRCSGLGFERAFTYSTSLTKLCSTDIITVIDSTNPSFRRGSCGLGVFEKLAEKPSE